VKRLREARNTCEAVHTKRFIRSGSYEAVHAKRFIRNGSCEAVAARNNTCEAVDDS
jgi:hypothetical protein